MVDFKLRVSSNSAEPWKTRDGTVCVMASLRFQETERRRPFIVAGSPSIPCTCIVKTQWNRCCAIRAMARNGFQFQNPFFFSLDGASSFWLNWTLSSSHAGKFVTSGKFLSKPCECHGCRSAYPCRCPSSSLSPCSSSCRGSRLVALRGASSRYVSDLFVHEAGEGAGAATRAGEEKSLSIERVRVFAGDPSAASAAAEDSIKGVKPPAPGGLGNDSLKARRGGMLSLLPCCCSICGDRTSCPPGLKDDDLNPFLTARYGDAAVPDSSIVPKNGDLGSILALPWKEEEYRCSPLLLPRYGDDEGSCR